ncbi:MAG: hypothetical protein ACE366_13575 [Bradymonadia bacterium]
MSSRLTIALLLLPLWAGCGGSREEPATGKATSADAAPAQATPPKPVVGKAIKAQVGHPGMASFLAEGFGDANKVSAALKRFAPEGLDLADMDVFELRDPQITAQADVCFTVEATAGITLRTYVLCWASDAQLASVKFKGMR